MTPDDLNEAASSDGTATGAVSRAVPCSLSAGRIPARIVKSRLPSPVSKSGPPSSFCLDITTDQHASNLRRFI
jgi:hypothetical protein